MQILPQIEEQDLYESIRMDEPWDSPHNRQFHDQMPDIFALPSSDNSSEGKTVYLRPIHSTSLFGNDALLTFEDISDGLSNTVHLVEVSEQDAVPWMKPVDFQVEPSEALNRLLPGRWTSGWSNGFNMALMDGTVHLVEDDMKPGPFAGMLTPNGGEKVDW